MIRNRSLPFAVVAFLTAATAMAQTGQGGLRGYVKDEQGGALPGVTVTATSPALIQPATAVSDAEGSYRLVNLPPGTYTIAAELASFASYSGASERFNSNFLQMRNQQSARALQLTVIYRF